MNSDPLLPFREALQNSYAALAGSGKKSIGFFCSYTPVEIIHAAGFIPVRITGGYGNIDQAYQHVPDFICPYMKRSLEKAMNGQYDFISGLVQGYTCDAACGMVNIWRDVVKPELVHSLPIPYNHTNESVSYFRSVLDELVYKLNTLDGHFTPSALNDSLDLYHRIRSMQYTLYEKRFKRETDLCPSDFMAIMDAGSVMPPEDYLAILENWFHQIPYAGGNRPEDAVPVTVSGSLVERPEILDMIEDSGARIVADDLCNGFRQILPPDGRGKTSMDRLIHRYINRFPCPARSRAPDRGRRMLEILKQSGSKGVIFLIQKFCTPHLADIPILSDLLKQAGYPSVVIEMDETWRMEGQIKTRLEGFVEMIRE